MNLLDRAIAALAPRYALSRVQARTALDAVGSIEAAYEAATLGRQASGWTTAGTSANAEIAPSLKTTRDRIRAQVRDDPMTAKAVRTLADNAVSTGVRPSPEDDGLSQLWEEEFVPNADADGRLSFYGMEHLAARTVHEGGEVFVRARTRRASDGLRIPLQLQMLEGDFCDETLNVDEIRSGPNRGGRIVMGVEFDRLGRRRFYHMYPVHPGEMGAFAGMSRYQPKPIPADQIVHVYEMMRPGQVRGISRGAPTVMPQRHLADYLHADMIAKKLAACFVGVVKRPAASAGPPYGSVDTPASGGEPRIEVWRPGGTVNLNHGEEWEPQTPPISSNFDTFVSLHQHLSAIGWGLTYFQQTGDLTGASYSSSRMGMLDFKAGIECFQWNTVVHQLCLPIWVRFNADARMFAGARAWEPAVSWGPPKVEDADPMKSALARQLEARSLFKTLSDIHGELGQDTRQVVAEAERVAKMLDDAGLVSDADARHVTKTGVAHNVDPLADVDAEMSAAIAQLVAAQVRETLVELIGEV